MQVRAVRRCIRACTCVCERVCVLWVHSALPRGSRPLRNLDLRLHQSGSWDFDGSQSSREISPPPPRQSSRDPMPLPAPWHVLHSPSLRAGVRGRSCRCLCPSASGTGWDRAGLSRNAAAERTPLWLVWGSCCPHLLPVPLRRGRGRFLKLLLLSPETAFSCPYGLTA